MIISLATDRRIILCYFLHKLIVYFDCFFCETIIRKDKKIEYKEILRFEFIFHFYYCFFRISFLVLLEKFLN